MRPHGPQETSWGPSRVRDQEWGSARRGRRSDDREGESVACRGPCRWWRCAVVTEAAIVRAQRSRTLCTSCPDLQPIPGVRPRHLSGGRRARSSEAERPLAGTGGGAVGGSFGHQYNERGEVPAAALPRDPETIEGVRHFGGDTRPRPPLLARLTIRALGMFTNVESGDRSVPVEVVELLTFGNCVVRLAPGHAVPNPKPMVPMAVPVLGARLEADHGCAPRGRLPANRTWPPRGWIPIVLSHRAEGAGPLPRCNRVDGHHRLARDAPRT